jgi:hypothetical protein
MAELRRRFTGADRVPVPDLWDRIEEREPGKVPRDRRRSVALVTALAVAAAGITFGASVFAGRNLPTDAASGVTPSAPTQTPTDGEGYSSCGSTATFRGVEYGERYIVVRPVPGEALGTATVPQCGEGPALEVTVYRVDGVEPDVAVVAGDGEHLFINTDLDKLPKELRRYTAPPPCNPADEPVELRGTWLGIFGADRKTEVDLLPPYDVYLRVAETSSPAYERVESITVRVPESLGTPITHEDVVRSLWQGGDIRVVARCLSGPYTAKDGLPAEDGFEATEIEVFPG